MLSGIMQREDQIPTRHSLVKRLKDTGDQESWREFFETYWKLLYSFALKRGCTDVEAEDVVQETVISVSRKMPEFTYDPAHCSFKGWLMHVTNKRVIDQLRKRNHRLVPKPSAFPDTATGSTFAQVPDPGGLPLEAIWKDEWEKNLIGAALERVKRRVKAQHYQVFHLLIVKQHSAAEVSEMLGVSRAAVYLAKHRVGTLVKREVAVLEKAHAAGRPTLCN